MINLTDLNEKQKEFVLSDNGPHMVLAGAGSGKTKALTSRIAYLIKEKGVKPWEILAVTFTNKAAQEMRYRVVKMTNLDESSLNIFTFHSLCIRILRQEKTILNLGNFSIYDDNDAKTLVKNILKEEDESKITVNQILDYIDYLKNNGYSKKYNRNLEQIEINPDLHDYFNTYEEELDKNNAVDFGGIITKVLDLFDEFPQIKLKYQQKYKHFLVDEYQDTNRAQFFLCNTLAEMHKNIYIVLDLDQSIYSFRYANINNTLDFEKIYPTYKLIKLEQNYRSTKKILAAANCVISYNKKRKDKRLYTQNDDGENIKILRCYNQIVEATSIAKWAKQLLTKGVNPNQIAVFFRNNSLSRSIEDALRKERINYMLFGGLKFYERKEIKDMISYLKLVVNPNDNVAIQRIINIPARAVGTTSLIKLIEQSNKEKTPIFELIKNSKNLSKKQQDLLTPFVNLITNLQEMVKNKCSLRDVYLTLLRDSGYEDMLKTAKTIEEQSRLENIYEFLNTFIEFDKSHSSLIDALESMALYSDSDEVTKENSIVLMTIHASKGLEFDHVFICGNEENIFPSIKSLNSDNQDTGGLEEERRLFYVAMTRARKDLYLSFCYERMTFGKKSYNEASRFIQEIPEDTRTLIDVRS
jgi:DNA helicase-2/ATP-dependent DNA helicase PcrA